MSEHIPTSDDHFDVTIIGGGPAGQIVAIELGRRGIRTALVDENLEPPSFPKANATTARSMEHYRRLGFAKGVRARALPIGYPTDIVYLNRYSGDELTRLVAANLDSGEWETAHTSRWPTPEPLARVQQMYVEAEMRKCLGAYPSVTCFYGFRAYSLRRSHELQETDRGPDHEVQVMTGNGDERILSSRFVVGADGPRSLVREELGLQYDGFKESGLDFMGGRMLATYFRSTDFYQHTHVPRAWQYWAMNRDQRGLICAIDGSELFVHHTPLFGDRHADETEPPGNLLAAMGEAFEFEVLGYKEWTAGFALVAEQYDNKSASPTTPGEDSTQPKLGRQEPSSTMFLVGDAAHLFTPTGGQGYNTAVDDAANLGWKLAAVCAGWGGEKLLASYDAERRPIGHRNTTFARAMAASIGGVAIPEGLEDTGPDQEGLRHDLAAVLDTHVAMEFDIPGITFGVSYFDSEIVDAGDSEPVTDEWNEYVPTSTPGSRAPHVWLNEQESIHDRFGPDFTLLALTSTDAVPIQTSIDAAKTIVAKASANTGVPIRFVSVSDERALQLYATPFVLIRPDHHIAWRGKELPADFTNNVRRAVGAVT